MTWRVQTKTAYYEIDMFESTATRHRLEGPIEDGFYQIDSPADGRERDLENVLVCQVGQRMHLRLRALFDGVERDQLTTPVVSITEVP